jgi:hypothetical protein
MLGNNCNTIHTKGVGVSYVTKNDLWYAGLGVVTQHEQKGKW